MDIKQRFNEVVRIASGKAKQTYEHVRLDMKIKAYEKEVEQIKLAIGEMVYQAGGIVDQLALAEHFEAINTINSRLNRLKKRKAEAKEEKIDDLEVKHKPEHTALKRKDNDLRIGRTQGGISVLRYCIECGAQNNSASEKCEKCMMPLL